MPRLEPTLIRVKLSSFALWWQVFDEIKAEYDAEIASAKEQGKDPELEAIHERSALKCLQLARTNGGIYNKAAQFVASLQGGAGEQVGRWPW